MYADLKVDKYSQCIPVFTIQRMLYYREEKRGYVSLIPPNTTGTLSKLLNGTTAFILKQMSGENTVYDIYNIMVEKYGRSYCKQIENDLSKIIIDLWASNIITWKEGENPLMKEFEKRIDNEYKVRIAFDFDIKKIIEFIEASNKTDSMIKYINSISLTQEITPLILRYSLFSMNSIFFLLEKDDEIEGVFACNTSPITTTATVDFLICQNEHIEVLLYKAIELINLAAKSESKRIRFFINKDGDEYLKIMLKKVGFESIALLKKELDNIDLEILDWNWGVR